MDKQEKHTPQSSFDLMPDLYRDMPRIRKSNKWWWSLVYGVRAVWRHLRVSRILTPILGPQYSVTHNLIEIDITYQCNLHCLNCNRSVTQARESKHMELAMVSNFVDTSISRKRNWRRIRILGGEPTIHPEFNLIIKELLRYKAWNPECIVEVVSNGYGAFVRRQLDELPDGVMVDRGSEKDGPIQTHFTPFNSAPKDNPLHAFSDYTNGCSVLNECGIGLTPYGYYPCAVAGGIHRITGTAPGRKDLPEENDTMKDLLRASCQNCGRFQNGHFVPRSLRGKLDKEIISPTWQRLYKNWHEARGPKSNHGPDKQESAPSVNDT